MDTNRPKECTDTELSRAMRNRDDVVREKALGKFIRATMEFLFNSLYVVSRRFSIDEHDFQTIFNDTISAFWEAVVVKKKVIENPCGYFYQTGRYLLQKFSAGRNKYTFIEPDETLGETDPAIERLWATEYESILYKAISMLKPEDLEIIDLFYLQEKSHKEIATLLGIKEENSRNRLSRALERLRQNFRDLLKGGEL